MSEQNLSLRLSGSEDCVDIPIYFLFQRRSWMLARAVERLQESSAESEFALFIVDK